MSKIAVHWFRRDLRIQDNPSLHYASENSSVMSPFLGTGVILHGK